MRTTARATTRASVTAAVVACFCLGAIGTATAADGPSRADRAEAGRAATAPATLETLSRFFARDGAVTRAAAAPRVVDGATVPVYTLTPEFVAGKAGAPVARLEFLAARAVSSDGREASLWTARQGGRWQVVNIATGDDEFRYAGLGARRLPGGTVFREPQIDAWYVSRGSTVLPLDEDAIRAVGSRGTTLAAYQHRVGSAYGDKLPGSAYARKGGAGGYGRSSVPSADAPSADAASVGSTAAGAGALATLALIVTAAWHRRRA
ncbi:hypothetical protein OG905_30990 [Streptomyces sp. NBC_00322]|uniref:hypothetical protein n=1 Tax=Streptomyces sp. NBC_00322 TaxID=2975712 RepID=UPI002E2E6E44|nr:hypothetical protein [Streptomyces sp. NBC_00322]